MLTAKRTLNTANILLRLILLLFHTYIIPDFDIKTIFFIFFGGRLRVSIPQYTCCLIARKELEFCIFAKRGFLCARGVLSFALQNTIPRAGFVRA
jgi:hypothetical protein